MTLDKPEEEECGNCYYCISRIHEEVLQSFLLKPDKTREVERYWCKRYPATEWKEKNSWCGEWKERKGDQQQ